MIRPVFGVALAAVLLVLCGTGLRAQTPGSVIGVSAGWVSNEQAWTPDAETEPVRGVQLGGFVNAATPKPWLSIRAEALWTQRGGSVLSVPGATTVRGEIRTDYLTIAVQPRLGMSAGRLSLFAAAGPVIDQIVRNRFDASLAGNLQAVGTVLGVGAGLGLGVRVDDRYRAEVEVRYFGGLGDAYDGPFVSATNRSLEVVARVGVPLRR